MTAFNLIFFSGLAADENVFAAQQSAFPQLQVVPWLVPKSEESLSTYSKRLIEPYSGLPNLVLGGASFGGIIAQYAAQHCSARCVILIGSTTDPNNLPWFAKLSRPCANRVKWLPIKLLQLSATAAHSLPIWPQRASHLRNVMGQFAHSDRMVFEWSLRNLLQWRDQVHLDVPIFHIHGQRDKILRRGETYDGQVIPRAGHLISLTHSEQVNAFIRQSLQRLQG